ncbi:MAG: hypothetical protein ACK4IY_01595 [Chitinophagales bacterium]
MAARLLTGCGEQRIPSQQQEKPLARVYDKYLYPADVKGLLSAGISAEDSAQLVSTYIDNWIQQNIILKIAEDNLQQELTEINRQAKEYRESLLIYAYEKYWLTQNLDTLINEDSLLSYYNLHLSDFLLQTDIYQISYAIIPLVNSKYDSLRYWFSRDIAQYRNNLESFCLTNCTGYLFEGQVWFSTDALLRILPFALFEDNKFRTTQLIESKDDEYRYIVKVHAYKTQGSQAPFEYVREDIRRIMINKRKMLLLKNNYQKIVSEAMRINNAEIY